MVGLFFEFLVHRTGVSLLFGIAVVGCADSPAPSRTASPATASGDSRWNLDERIRSQQELIGRARSAADSVVAAYEPRLAFQVDDLSISVVDALAGLPGVGVITVSPADKPTSRILHLVSPEAPSEDDFLVTLKQMADGGVSQQQLKALHGEYLLQIELLHWEHLAILKCLVQRHGLSRIYVESKVGQEVALTRNPNKPASLGGQLDGADGNGQASVRSWDWVALLQSEHSGTSGHWETENITPLESDVVDTAPVIKQFNRSWKLVQQRTDQAMDREIRRALADGSCCLNLGDANDFTDSVTRVSNGKCEYVRIETKQWQATEPLDPNVWGR